MMLRWAAVLGLVAASFGVATEPAAAVDTPLVISATSVAFPDTGIGVTSAPVAVTLTNTSGSPFGPLNMFGGAPGAPFSASQSCQAVTLAAGASCQVTYTFVPDRPGAGTGSSGFTISATANQSDGEDFSVSLTGRAFEPLTASPSGLDFGDVAVGATAKRGVRITNTAQVAIGPLVVVAPGEPPSTSFRGVQACQGVTLAAGQSCQVDYTFAPTSAGRVVDASTLLFNTVARPDALHVVTVPLTGCGPPCGPLVKHVRSISLSLGGDGLVKGRVAVPDGETACRSGVGVQIQRQDGSRWKTVGKATTNGKGKFRKKVSAGSGKYRATVRPTTVALGAAVCLASVSRVAQTG